MSIKKVEPDDRIVAIGGRTGRDGIHGATFSSIELTAQSESLSGGAVQIGNAIVEKMVLDVIVQARDQGLFRSITDCGAGGFSSAVGEMGAELGAEVELDRAPLKYQGLSYTEIWISEAQERMVLAVPPDKWPALKALCDSEDVEATDLGRFVDSGRLTSALSRPGRGRSFDELPARRPADRRSRGDLDGARVSTTGQPPERSTFTADLVALLQHWDVCSKEWIIRQYDHEVQARTVIKPLVGERDDGPGDASVVLPVRGSTRGLAVACGINPRYGKTRPLRDGGVRHRRGDSQLRGRRRRSRPDRSSRQFLLGQHRAARDARLAGAGRAGVPRRGPGLRHAVHLGQGQPEQRIHARGPEPGDPPYAPDQRHRPGSPTCGPA